MANPKEKQITQYSKIAWTLAGTSGFMFIIPILAHILYDVTYTPIEYATFVGGTAGPLSALAGFLFVYIAFQGQQIQIEKQDQQFQLQSFENTFFQLLTYHEKKQEDFLLHKKNFYSQREKFKRELENYSTCKRLEFVKIETLLSQVSVDSIDMDILKLFYKKIVIVDGTQYLIKSITNLLEHIDVSPDHINKEKYRSILYNRIATTEKILITSYTLFDRRDMKDYEYSLLVHFAKRIDKIYYIFPHFFDFLQKLGKF